MASSSPWVRPFVWIAAVIAMSIPLLASSQPELAGSDREDITDLLMAQVEAWNDGDLEEFMGAYDRQEIVFASGGEITRGWQTVLDRYEKRYDSPEKMGKLSFTILQIDALGRDHAKALGEWELARSEDRPHGLFTLILAREGASWRIIHDHTSSAPDESES